MIKVTKDESTATVKDRWNLYVGGKFAGTWRGTESEAAAQAEAIAAQYLVWAAEVLS